MITRRVVLSFLATSGAGLLLPARLLKGEAMKAEHGSVDHLLLGISDLQKGIQWVESKTGVKAVIGGSHPGRGTHNALLSLGGQQYLELIAPDPAQKTYSSALDLHNLHEPRLITWAAATSDIDATAEDARNAGLRVMGPNDGSRKKPDGGVLKWRTLAVMTEFALKGIEPVPFFIQWAEGTEHPSQSSPGGCELQSFEIEHPDADKLRETFGKLGVRANVRKAPEARLIAVLKTPNGRVTL